MYVLKKRAPAPGSSHKPFLWKWRPGRQMQVINHILISDHVQMHMQYLAPFSTQRSNASKSGRISYFHIVYHNAHAVVGWSDHPTTQPPRSQGRMSHGRRVVGPLVCGFNGGRGFAQEVVLTLLQPRRRLPLVGAPSLWYTL